MADAPILTNMRIVFVNHFSGSFYIRSIVSNNPNKFINPNVFQHRFNFLEKKLSRMTILLSVGRFVENGLGCIDDIICYGVPAYVRTSIRLQRQYRGAGNLR